MAKTNLAAEPSMEEILASIRRIIADEDPAAPSQKQASRDFISSPIADEDHGHEFKMPTKVNGTDDVLDLASAEEDSAEAIPARQISPVDMDDVSFGAEPTQFPDPTPAPVARAPKTEWNQTVTASPQQQQTPFPSHGGLTSLNTEAAVSAAFNSLANSIFSSEPRTIEDLTKELLRPLMKQWLDDNLPSLVERMVREEIERVARGRR